MPGPLSSIVSTRLPAAARHGDPARSRAAGCSGSRCRPGCAPAPPAAWRRPAPCRRRPHRVRSSAALCRACGASSATTWRTSAPSSSAASGRRGAGLQPRQRQQLLDQPRGAVAARERGLERVAAPRVVGLGQRHLGLGADGGDRRAQFVRGIGGEPALRLHQARRCARTARSAPPASAPSPTAHRPASPAAAPAAGAPPAAGRAGAAAPRRGSTAHHTASASSGSASSIGHSVLRRTARRIEARDATCSPT